MMHRLRRYDVFRFAQNDVARFTRNDAMFAQCAVRHASLGKAVIIGVANIICRRQTSFAEGKHHLPKANIIQKYLFCQVDKRGIFVGAP